jgi:hypothetical protein
VLIETNKFNEDVILNKLKVYIGKTYKQHYGSGNIQTTVVTFDAGHGESFCLGNILKYAQRFGKKNGRNEQDLYKIIHYAIMILGQMEKERAKAHQDFVDHMQEDAE